MVPVHPVTLYIRPGGPGDEAPLLTFAPDLAPTLTPIVRREAAGIVFVVHAVDEPEQGEDPERSLGHATPTWGAPDWGSPGWDEPSWTTSPSHRGLSAAPQGYAEDRVVISLQRRASVVPQLVGLLHATTEGGELTVRQQRIEPDYDVPEVTERIEAFLGRFASTNRFTFGGGR